MAAMAAMSLTPRRRRGVELLDGPDVDPAVRLRSLQDVARSNRLFGGRSAMVVELRRVMPALPTETTLVDVGSGLGDLPAAMQRAARRHGIRMVTLALDRSPELARASAARCDHAVCADAFRLPLADRSVDLVTCSQFLHHFPDAEVRTLLRELDRVARRRVIVGDLRRSWVAAGGFWLAAFPLRFHPVTRHDGPLSVMRGFTAAELARHVAEATGVRPEVRRHAGWRLTASWSPSRAPSAGRGA